MHSQNARLLCELLSSRRCTEFVLLQSILEDRERFRRQEGGEGRLDQLTKHIVTSQSATCGRKRNNECMIYTKIAWI